MLLRTFATVSVNKLSATEHSKYLLDHESRPTFTSSPPLIPFGLFVFSQPAFPAKIVPKLLHSIANPFAFTNERWHPSCVVECRGQSEEWNDGRQLMEKQESRDMRQWRIDQGRFIALQEFGKARSNAHDTRAGLFWGFGLEIIRLGVRLSLVREPGKPWRRTRESPSNSWKPSLFDHQSDFEASSSYVRKIAEGSCSPALEGWRRAAAALVASWQDWWIPT